MSTFLTGISTFGYFELKTGTRWALPELGNSNGGFGRSTSPIEWSDHDEQETETESRSPDIDLDALGYVLVN